MFCYDLMDDAAVTTKDFHKTILVIMYDEDTGLW